MRDKLWHSVDELEARDGVLYFDGCSVPALAAAYGTPLYVYSESRLRANYRRLHTAITREHPAYDIYYALKVNNNPALVAALRAEGAGADCASVHEIDIALAAGVPPDRILFTGAFVSPDELRAAISRGVQINLAETDHLRHLAQGRLPSLLSFRVNPGPIAASACGFALGGEESKFGIDVAEAIDAYRTARALGIERFGLHAMAGSNVLGLEYFDELLAFVCQAARTIAHATGVTFEFLDLGGSLGVPYHRHESELDVEELGRRLVRTLRAQFPAGSPLPRLIQEPGRYLVADAGILVTTVTAVKHGTPRFVGVDAGMNTLVRPAMYDAHHEVLLATDVATPRDVTTHLVGQICENRDFIARARPLPGALRAGDVIALLTAGAYGFAMSSNFHAKPLAAEVLVREGVAEVIRARQSHAEMLGQVSVPDRLRPTDVDVESSRHHAVTLIPSDGDALLR